jgi:hypothetical protein
MRGRPTCFSRRAGANVVACYPNTNSQSSISDSPPYAQRVHRALARRATAALSLRDDPAVVPFPSAASSSRRTAEEDGSFSGEEPRPSASFSVPSLSALSDGHGADQLIPDT